MNAKYFLPAVAVMFAACSEPTAPAADLSTSFGKAVAPPTVYSQNFETGIASLGAWTLSTLTTSPGSANMSPTTYLGRLSNQEVALTLPAGMTSLTLQFDLYIIGTWDGAGMQGYGSDQWQIEVSRNGGARENVFHTSFSNQGTKPQHFPKQVTDGTSPNDRGALAINVLGYPKGTGQGDVGDAIYRLKYKVLNPSGGPVVFYFHPTTLLQDINDESWGIDNVSVSGS